MGHFQRDVGRSFEEAIENKLTVLEQQRIVSWWQHNQPGWVRRGGQYVRASASGPDFTGILVGGLGFAMEAKSTGVSSRTGRLEEFVLEARVTDLQASQLAATARDGGLSLVVLQFRPELEPWGTYAVPWRLAPWRKRKVNHSLAMAELEAWRIPAEDRIFERFLAPHALGFALAPSAQP